MNNEELIINNEKNNVGAGHVSAQSKNKYNANQRGITLIALIITIIILLILAGVTISVLIGENGLFNTASRAGEKYEQATAREKLEALLIELQADKITKPEVYDENEYINNKLKENNMTVNGELVTVDGWQFQIDRSVPKIIASLEKDENIAQDKVKNAHYLYYKGEEYLEEGGEWINSPKSAENNIAELNKNKDSMTFEAGIALYMNPFCAKKLPLDISPYDKISIEMEIVEEDILAENRNIGIYVLNKDGNINGIVQEETIYYPRIGKIPHQIGEKVIISMELIDAENMKEVYFGLSSHGYKIKIYSIYLEKYKHEILNLYNLGNEYSTIGGDWINNPKYPESHLGKLSKENNSMIFEIGIPSAYNPICTKEKTMDISNYDLIKIEMEVMEENISSKYRNVMIEILDVNGNRLEIETMWQPAVSSKKVPVIGEKITRSMRLKDIENLNDVYFGPSGNGYKIRIYRIWLDKIIK